MAKFKIKGKKVTGTKKKDKIVWQKSWKKNLTVDALKGNDTIDFTKSKKTNTFIGGKGNDIIKTGKGTSTIVINKGDGNDTIYHNSKKTTIKVNKAKSSDKQVFERKGNDLILSYTHGGTTTKEVLTFKDYYKGNKNIYLGKKKLETLISSKGMTITSSGNIQGTNGNDTIYGSKGNDTINAGKGNNTIYLNKNEGTDTIQNGGGKDTLIFSQERNFDNFTFTENGADLNIKAGGTTAVLKGYNADKSGVKSIKAGNQSLNKMIIKENAHNEEIQGSAGNDLFLISNGNENKIYTGTGNDIVYINNENNDKVYASEGNNYINIKESSGTTIYLDKMSGNNTFTTDWKNDFMLKFDVDGDSADEMVRTITLAPGDGYYKYVLGQKSGNDLVMKSINGKTATIKYFFNDFYEDSYYATVQDKSDTLNLGRFSNKRIFFSENPGYIKLTGNSGDDTLNNQQNKYIYGKADIAYTVTMNDASYNNIVIAGDKTKTINIENSLQNYMDIYGGYSKSININNAQYNYLLVSGGEITLTMNGSNNYAFVSGATTNSVLNFNGNYNYIETTYLSGTTVNINGNGNYANISALNNVTTQTITVNTTGLNEVNLYYEYIPSSSSDTTFNINSTGNDTFYQTDYGDYSYKCKYNYDFTGSEGKNKFINASHNNTMRLSGTDDAGEIKILTESTLNYAFRYYQSENSISLKAYNMDTMKFHGISANEIYGPDIAIYGGESNINTAAFANKIKINTEGDNGEFKSLNNFAQYFDFTDDTFLFGNETMGYMKNLTNDYIIIDGFGIDATTYSGFEFSHGRHTIVDKGGSNDKITINETNLDTYDVKIYYNITAEGEYGSDLYFLKSSEYLDFMKGNDVSGYIKVQDAFNQGKIETVRVSVKNNNFSLFYDRLVSNSDGSLIQEVASWLTSDGRNFSDTADVLSRGTDAEKTALFGIFDKHSTYSSDCYNPYFDS